MTEHGEAGHVNRYVRDHDSFRTGYAAHDRIVCFENFVRIDSVWGLGHPSDAQIIEAYRKYSNGRKVKLMNFSRDEDGSSVFVDVEFGK